MGKESSLYHESIPVETHPHAHYNATSSRAQPTEAHLSALLCWGLNFRLRSDHNTKVICSGPCYVMDRVHNICTLLLQKTHHKLPGEPGTKQLTFANAFQRVRWRKLSLVLQSWENVAKNMSESSLEPCWTLNSALGLLRSLGTGVCSGHCCSCFWETCVCQRFHDVRSSVMCSWTKSPECQSRA